MGDIREELINEIQNNITSNGHNDITGKVLRDVLIDMTNGLATGGTSVPLKTGTGNPSVVWNDGDSAGIANGDYSTALGKKTIAENDGESAFGIYNASHNSESASGKTIFSVGDGDIDSRSNAVEIMKNGDVYVKGVGGYDGDNLESASTLQEIINSGGSGSNVSISNLLNSGSRIATITINGSSSDVYSPTQEQSDWNEVDSNSVSYIKNKPTIQEQVQSDWNESNSNAKSYIKNKPDISSLTGAMHFAGVSSTALTDGGTETPTIDGHLYSPHNGDVVIYSDTEYLWTGTKWQKLGDDSSFALKTISITGSGYLTGGGTLTENRSIDISVDSLATSSNMISASSIKLPTAGAVYDYISENPISTASYATSASSSSVAGSASVVDWSGVTNKPTIPAEQVQSDWDVTDTSSKAFIKNKPSIVGQVQSDWDVNDTSSAAYIQNKPTIPTVPSNVSAFTNDVGYVTSSGSVAYATSASSSSVAGSATNADTASYATSASSSSVAGSASTVDWSGVANKPTIPPAQVQSNWNESNPSSVAYIQNKPTIPAEQIQSDWNVTDTSSKAFIKNKPSIVGQVQSDWDVNDTSSAAYIQNKPTIPAAQVQSNWNESDTGSVAYIQNKPHVQSVSVSSKLSGGTKVATITIDNFDTDIYAPTGSGGGSGSVVTIDDLLSTGSKIGVITIDGASSTIYSPEQIQSNWNESDTSSKAYIQNKPTIPTVPSNVSAFTNDAGYVTSAGSVAYATSASSSSVAGSAGSVAWSNVSGRPDVSNFIELPTARTVSHIVVFGNNDDIADSDCEVTNDPDDLNYGYSGYIPTCYAVNEYISNSCVMEVTKSTAVSGGDVIQSGSTVYIKFPTGGGGGGGSNVLIENGLSDGEEIDSSDESNLDSAANGIAAGSVDRVTWDSDEYSFSKILSVSGADSPTYGMTFTVIYSNAIWEISSQGGGVWYANQMS